MDAFSSMTSLNINFDKSTFVPINVDSEATSHMDSIMGCPVATFPRTYTGMPLSAHEFFFTATHVTATATLCHYCGS
jgi:hypothetical protein